MQVRVCWVFLAAVLVVLTGCTSPPGRSPLAAEQAVERSVAFG